MAIATCIENYSGAVLNALAASNQKCSPSDNPQLPITVGIQDEICPKKRMRRRRQITRDSALRAEVTTCRGR